MNLLRLQSLIARVCLSRSFRAEFAADRDAAIIAMGLDAEEQSLAKMLPIESISDFGDKLIVKRIQMIRRWLPLSFRALDRHLTSAVVDAHLDRFTQEQMRDWDEYATTWKRVESARVARFLQSLIGDGA